jgi:hypothetical protein
MAQRRVQWRAFVKSEFRDFYLAQHTVQWRTFLKFEYRDLPDLA